MKIENNDTHIIITLTPDEAEELSSIIHYGLNEAITISRESAELWQRAEDAIYGAAFQALAMQAKNLGG